MSPKNRARLARRMAGFLGRLAERQSARAEFQKRLRDDLIPGRKGAALTAVSTPLTAVQKWGKTA
jgi:hypothetical protein